MKRLQKLGVALVIVAFLLMVGTAMAGDKKPSGSIVINETQVMLMVGGDIGGGSLLFNGEIYTFKTSGLKLGGVGVHKLELTGDVYHLNKASDLDGVYFVAEAGATLVKGKGGFWMKNDKGVTIHLKASAEGVALNLGVEGFHILHVRQY